MKLTAIIEREGSGYVSLCPNSTSAVRETTVEQARENLREALGLFFECAPPEEIKARLKSELYVTQVDIAVEVFRAIKMRLLRQSEETRSHVA